jgi:hypothetical protein
LKTKRLRLENRIYYAIYLFVPFKFLFQTQPILLPRIISINQKDSNGNRPDFSSTVFVTNKDKNLNDSYQNIKPIHAWGDFPLPLYQKTITTLK